MPIDAVSSASRSAGAGMDPRLQRGAVIDARVTAVGSDGTVRLVTALGTADIATDVPLEPGQAVRLVVQNAAAGLTLALLTEDGGDQAVRQPAAAPATGPAQAPALLRAVAEVMQRNDLSTSGMSALFANLPTLLKGETAGLPAAAVAPAADVLAHALSTERPVTAQAVKAAVAGSGVFREARLAQGNPAAGLPAADLKSALIAFRTVLGGIVEALESVRPGPSGPAMPAQQAPTSALAQSTPSATATFPAAPFPGGPSSGPAAVPQGVTVAPGLPEFSAGPTPAGTRDAAGSAPTVLRNGNATSGDAARALPAAGLSVTSPSRPDIEPSGAFGATEPWALPPAIAAAVANLPEPGRSQLIRLLSRSLSGEAPDSSSVREILLKAGVVADTELASRGAHENHDRPVLGRYGEQGSRSAAGGSRGALESSLPRADLPPRPDPSSIATLTGGSGTEGTARVLMRETDQALDRTLLNQYASLPREAGAPGAPHGQHAQAWVMDVPVLMGREATTAQMRITRDGGGHDGRSSGEPRRWSVDFALDSIALGPVHAHIKLVGDGVGVTLWAERPDTADALKQSSAQLRRALDDAALSVDEVDFHLGAPARPAAPKGYLVDTQS